MNPELIKKKTALESEIKRLSDDCTYIMKLKDAISNIQDIKLKNYYNETLSYEIFKIKPQLKVLRGQIYEIINDFEKENLPKDFNLYKIVKNLDWI